MDNRKSIDDFANAVAYLWDINERIRSADTRGIGKSVASLQQFVVNVADNLGMEKIDAAFMVLNFFIQFAQCRKIEVAQSTETIALACALQQHR